MSGMRKAKGPEVMTSESNLRGRIARLSIRGFRSLARVENVELPQLAVLIGANGSGKSNLIRFFEMLSFSLKARNLQQFVLDRGGGDDQLFLGSRTTPRMEAEITVETEQATFDLAEGGPNRPRSTGRGTRTASSPTRGPTIGPPSRSTASGGG